MIGSPSLLIIPFYNEFDRISLGDYIAAFSTNSPIDFLLVDDGSTDKTGEILNQFATDFSNVQVLLCHKNVGKAEAIRTAVLGFPMLKYRYIGYLDADLATPVDELIQMISFANKHPQYSFLMGSRIKKMGSTIIRYSYRHYFGRFFATIVSAFVLKTPVYDTQCGAKIIEKNLALSLFKEPFISRWLFDIELLLRFKQQHATYASRIYEYSLKIWIERGQSKITLRDLLGFPLQLLKIHRYYG